MGSHRRLRRSCDLTAEALCCERSPARNPRVSISSAARHPQKPPVVVAARRLGIGGAARLDAAQPEAPSPRCAAGRGNRSPTRCVHTPQRSNRSTGVAPSAPARSNRSPTRRFSAPRRSNRSADRSPSAPRRSNRSPTRAAARRDAAAPSADRKMHHPTQHRAKPTEKAPRERIPRSSKEPLS